MTGGAAGLTGGTSSAASSSAAGGIGSVGGTASSGGTTQCVCVNPHLPTCEAACVAGVCKTSVIADLGSARQSGDKANTLRHTGFWDGDGNPYVVYPAALTPFSIYLHRLDANGAIQTNAPDPYRMPDDVVDVGDLSVAYDGNRLGLLWQAARKDDGVVTIDFATTTTTGAASTPVTLNYGVAYGNYPDQTIPLFLYPLGTNLWANIAHHGGAAYLWQGYVINAVTPAYNAQLADFSQSPRSVARMMGQGIPQAAAVVDDTLFVTGYDSDWSPSSASISLICNRYDLRSFAPLTPLTLQLSVTSILPNSSYQRTPVIAKLGNRLAAFWTEFHSESFDANSVYLGNALFEKSGTEVLAPVAVKSRLIPKALVETPSGAGLLIAARIDGTDASPSFTLVAQRVDANLKFVGPSYALNTPAVEEPTQVEVHRAPNGTLVLINFRQGFAQHRVLHTDLCQ